MLINDRFDATEPTLSDHILDVLASFMCHKAKDWEDDETSKYTSSTVDNWNQHSIPENIQKEKVRKQSFIITRTSLRVSF
mgnify:CR=1 FL=1